MRITTAYALMWIALAIAVSVAVYATGNINCLWFLCIGLFVSVESKG